MWVENDFDRQETIFPPAAELAEWDSWWWEGLKGIKPGVEVGV